MIADLGLWSNLRGICIENLLRNYQIHATGLTMRISLIRHFISTEDEWLDFENATNEAGLDIKVIENTFKK
jgi:hypothetical protein